LRENQKYKWNVINCNSREKPSAHVFRCFSGFLAVRVARLCIARRHFFLPTRNTICKWLFAAKRKGRRDGGACLDGYLVTRNSVVGARASLFSFVFLLSLFQRYFYFFFGKEARRKFEFVHLQLRPFFQEKSAIPKWKKKKIHFCSICQIALCSITPRDKTNE
jgi:hypothetical protein